MYCTLLVLFQMNFNGQKKKKANHNLGSARAFTAHYEIKRRSRWERGRLVRYERASAN